MSKNTQKTKEKILDLLKEQGPQEAPALAESLGITAMAVRQHLYDLEADDIVETVCCPRPRGRPGKIWQLTEKSNELFPDSHSEFAVGLIHSIRETFGEEGMDKLLELRATEQVEAYRKELANIAGLSDRLEKLAALRSREGYMANVLPGDEPDQYLLVENHCPVCEAARECSGICARELQVFEELMGDDVAIYRTDHIIKGARRCAYVVRPYDPKANP
ncbi:metalloregulator ArsR/SmtB family transcription factor [Emcibacter sp.]|uniref:helix-turn-helix transcriptional regulator n=1 Tax=Emcibacter sp. TaxID=1979954 RepID=UPI002AA6FA55|nr:metalloregulator ArsR/SmtB family transcription factor [Emcibacter sp.]